MLITIGGLYRIRRDRPLLPYQRNLMYVLIAADVLEDRFVIVTYPDLENKFTHTRQQFKDHCESLDMEATVECVKHLQEKVWVEIGPRTEEAV